jgi:hypothetical protein
MWVYVLGVLVAGIAGALAFSNDILAWVLIVVAVLSGLFFLDSDDATHYGLRYLVLVAVAGALGAVPAVGGFITGFFTGVAGFIAPAALTLLAVYFYKKYIAGMMM